MSTSRSSRVPRISDAEWSVMKCFWTHGAMGMGEVVKALDSAHWKPRTVQTLIRRLVEKGALRVETSGRDFRYHAAVEQADCQRDEGRSFLERVFDGRLTPFVAAMVDREGMSGEEISALRQLLDEAESKGTKPASRSKRA